MTYVKPFENNCLNQTKPQKSETGKCLCYRNRSKKMLLPFGFWLPAFYGNRQLPKAASQNANSKNPKTTHQNCEITRDKSNLSPTQRRFQNPTLIVTDKHARLYLNNLPETNANFKTNQTAKKNRLLNAQRQALAVWRTQNQLRQRTKLTKETSYKKKA